MINSYRFFSWLIPILAVGLQAATGQTADQDEIRSMPAPDTDRICTLDHTDINAHFSLRAFQEMALIPDLEPSADFEITYRVTGNNSCGASTWPAEAINAFEYATDIWATHISSAIPIKVEAIWENINPLGSAGPTRIIHSDAVPLGEPDTWYAIAQASAMANVDFVTLIDDEDFHIQIQLDCGTNNWYFGTDAVPGSNQVDFTTVVLHEIGHGLGFIGTMTANQSQQQAEWGIAPSNNSEVYPIIYDRFVSDGDHISVLDESVYPNPSGALYDAVTGRHDGLFISGTDTDRMFTGMPAPIYAPSSWSSGSSYSHLDDNTFVNTENALMRPRIDQAFAIHTPGPVFCGILSDTGWPLGGGCRAFVDRDALIAVSPDTLNFEVLNIGNTSERVLVVSNDPESEDPISIRAEVEGTGFSIAPGSTQAELQPGQSHEVIVRFSPSSVEEYQGIVSVFHNAINEPSPIEVEVIGEALDRGVLARLDQNYPNPFQNATQIPYALPDESNVRIDIFNIIGQRVATLLNARQPAGIHEITFDANGLSSGVYFYRIHVDGFVRAKKLMLIR